MKKGFFILGIFLALGLWNLAFASELTDDYFDIATNYYSSNNYAKAIEYLDEILKIEPDNTQAQTLKDKIVPRSKETVEEQQATAKVLSNVQNPENFVILNVPSADTEKMNYNSDYYNTKGQELYCKKDYNAAIEYFYKATKLNCKNAQALNNLGMSYWQKNNPALAIKYFKRANAVNRGYTQPLVNLSQLYKQQGEEEKQFICLQRAIKCNPNDFWAYFLLGEYYKNNGIYLKSIDSYKEAIKINEKFPLAYMGLALSFFETEQFNYAQLALNQYLEYKPDSDYALLLLSKTELILGKYDLAKIDIQKAIEIKDLPEYRFEEGQIEYYLENYQGALDIFQNILKNGSSAEVLNFAGLCNYKLKKLDVAIADFNRAIDLDPLRPIYYYNLAQCYKSIGDKRKYLQYVTSATKINPINYQDFIDLSYIYYDNGNPGYALNALNDAIKKYPSIKALYLSKLKIYESLGDNEHFNETKNLINARFNE